MNGPGQIGDWQHISDLGSGAFGVVSLWRNNISNNYLAIKKCRFHTATSLSLKQKERWHKEVSIMKLINHPNIIRFQEIPPDLESVLLKNNPTNLPLLSMEYCQKGNLRHILQTPKNISGLEEQDVRCILEDISSGLQHLHNLKITHRDIKPDNIVLQHCKDRKCGTTYKIIDLGYAKELNDATVSFVGTLHYLAPEIFETVRYDSSVDYWSMGIMTFEIICGVLPFLPHLTPPQRFIEIKNKDPDDICIYLSYSGQKTNSSEIRKEHFISTCLKRDIEKWLRHVLNFNPQLRSQNFPNNVKVFDYLQNILMKKIVTVFSIYKFEFYSYEIDESTLMGTLKDWISRDIKTPRNDLILLFGKEDFSLDDNKLVCDIVKYQNNVYVIKKSAIISYPITYNLPKLVKEVVKSALKFDFKFSAQLYSQTVYYITKEKNTADVFKHSFHLYMDYLTYAVEALKKNVALTSKNIFKLLTKVECYTSIRKNNFGDIDVSDDKEYKDCLTFSQRLLSSLERSITRFRDLKKKNTVVLKGHKLLRSSWQEITKLLDKYDLQPQYEKAVNLLEASQRGKNVSAFKTGITNLISETIKIKENLLKDKTFKVFASAMGTILNFTENMTSWIKEFDDHIEELSKSFLKSEIVYRTVLIEAAKRKKREQSPSVSSLNGELLNLPSVYLIKENHDLRCRFEEILSKSILAHKRYTEAVNKMFAT